MKAVTYLLLILLCMSSVYAVSPFLTPAQQATINTGLVLQYPKFLTYPSDQTIGLSFHVFNQSNGVIFSNASINCETHVQNATGGVIFHLDDINTSGDIFTFYATSKEQGFPVGFYGWDIHCNHTSQNLGGYAAGNFETTESGTVEIKTDATSGLAVTIFLILFNLIFFILPMKKQMSSHIVADFIIKRCLVVIGLLVLSLNIVTIANIAGDANLDVLDTLFRYMWAVIWFVYILIIYLLWNTIIKSLDMWQDFKGKKRMGEE